MGRPVPRSLLAPLLSIPKGPANSVAAALSPPSEHRDLTHLPRGRTLIRFCTSSSLSESLVSATAWLWEARQGKVRAARGPPLLHGPSITARSPQDPVAPADGLSPLQVCVPWEEDVTFPVGEG